MNPAVLGRFTCLVFTIIVRLPSEVPPNGIVSTMMMNTSQLSYPVDTFLSCMWDD